MKVESIITISGRISSGKSYAAKLLQSEFGFPIASFGGYLKYYCESKSLSIDRKTLQDTGERFVAKDPKQFLIDVITHFIGHSDKIILEGVRHRSILEEVNKLFENRLAVFVEADLNTRFSRYCSRIKDTDEIKTYNKFIIADSHTVEMDIDSLKPLCNIVVDSSKDNDYTSELIKLVSNNLLGKNRC